jgi:hypothetical protein
VRRSTPVLGENDTLSRQTPLRLMGCQHSVSGAIIVIGTGHGSDGPHQCDFALAMPAVEFDDHRVILVKIGLHCTVKVAGDKRAVQPFVGVQQYWCHACSVGAIVDLFVNLGHPLPRMNLTNVGKAWEPRSAGLDWPKAFKTRAVGRGMADSRTSQIDSCLHASEA